jgi:hypothetical protein
MAWIAGAVIALVVLHDGRTPLAKPWKQWRDHSSTILGVATQHHPFLLVWRRWFVEQRRGYLELADVVEQGGPSQAGTVRLGQLQLCREQVGEDPHTLGMSTACSIVDIESQHELDDRGQILGVIDLAGCSGCFQPFAQFARGTGSPCDGKPRWCLVGE